MRRIVPLILVAVFAYGLGTMGAGGALTRLLGEPKAVSHAAHARVLPPDASSSAHVATETVTASTTAVLPTPSPVPSSPVPAPPAPLGLSQLTLGGAPLVTGAWSAGIGLALQVAGSTSGTRLHAEIEIRRLAEPFDGASTSQAPVNKKGVATFALPALLTGHYHWRARFISSAGLGGPWAAYAGGQSAFGVLTTPPAAPHVSSPTNPNPLHTYATAHLTVAWTAPPDPSGIMGYAYRVDTDPSGMPQLHLRTQQRTISLALSTGVFYIHVRAHDAAGLWSPTATFGLRIDTTPPVVSSRAFESYFFDPTLEPLHLTYTVTKVSHVSVGIYDALGTRVRHIVLPAYMPANVPLQLRWDGHDDRGAMVPAGQYAIYLRLTDRAGNAETTPGWGGLTVTYKRIRVSLSQQHLWAYDGKTLFLETAVTTGNKGLPTPTGVFHVITANHPFTFHSPWPPSSPYWYAPSPVNYALYFDAPGYFIHDAAWRTNYGAGSNSGAGLPRDGQDAGTHGCVNVQEATMAMLYAWAPPGTIVEVVP